MARAARREVSRFTWAAVRSRWRDVYAGVDDRPETRPAARIGHAPRTASQTVGRRRPANRARLERATREVSSFR